jgi:tRNA-splicing ligase RtcB
MPIANVFTWSKFPIKSWIAPVESSAVAQLVNVANLPFIFKHIAVMPDVHAGIGATIGSVIPTVGALVPSAVGVDIGCGISAMQTGCKRSDLPENLGDLRRAIEAAIPHGRTDNGGPADVGSWPEGEIPEVVKASWDLLFVDATSYLFDSPLYGPGIWERAQRQLGTLGGGNHYIEVCVDDQDDVWIQVHSGSRGIGNFIGKHFIGLAKKLMDRYFIELPDKELAYLPEDSTELGDYIRWMGWALGYATENRCLMVEAACDVLRSFTNKAVDLAEHQYITCHHNYAAKENHFGKNVWVTRKGAIRARQGDLGIIPGAMGRCSYVVEGLGNAESFCSASHGAGRVKGRKQAKREHSLAELQASMAGVECAVSEGMIDEIYSAYKDLDFVMECQSDLVKVVNTLRPLICIKGAE